MAGRPVRLQEDLNLDEGRTVARKSTRPCGVPFCSRSARLRPLWSLMIFRCQPGFETLLEKELVGRGYAGIERGEGWLRGAGVSPFAAAELCFAHQTLLDPVEITGDSVNALAARIADQF